MRSVLIRETFFAGWNNGYGAGVHDAKWGPGSESNEKMMEADFQDFLKEKEGR